MSSLYILAIRPLLVVVFAKLFYHFVVCLFFFKMVSFAVQKLLSLIMSHWFIFVFICHCSRRQIKQDAAAYFMSECSAYVFL